MQKNVFKTICVFTLVFFVLSMTGAACGNDCKTKTDAKNDKFTIENCAKYFNVLKNDKGCNLKVTTTGTIKTKLGGKVTMKNDGKFCYTKPANCKKSCTDSFKYTIKGCDGKTDSAKVTLIVKCSDCC
ncbi:Ig-like domain-containing protein [Methanosarcina sp. UBA5]|uniref:Ig-like domain-containing protein n=1 Tax=Methanosarcina sp. UBA5 TaxID=1915593 RepID=UPI0025DCCA54|nr:Ig-like domain-containing protein [Methanosarcina sp. UBA5]